MIMFPYVPHVPICSHIFIAIWEYHFQIQDASVCIVGHGGFTIENVRTCVERKSKKAASHLFFGPPAAESISVLVCEATKSTVLICFNVNSCCFDQCYLTWLSSAKCHQMSMVYSWNDVDVEIQMFWLVTNFIQCLLSNHHWQSSCFGKS
jgi:hypothetical protein